MADFDVVGDLITCPNCGAHNRVGAYSSLLRPVCGRCHGSLTAVIENIFKSAPASQRTYIIHPRKSRKRLTIGVVLAVLIVILAIIALFCAPSLMAPVTLKTPRPPLGASEDAAVLISSLRESSSYIQKRTPPPLINRRITNGQMIRNSGLYGMGQLTVKNGLSIDAAAKLISKRDNSLLAFFTIASFNQFTLEGVNDGNYRLIFCIGEDWDQDRAVFTRPKGCSEFEQPMTFTTTSEYRSRAVFKRYSILEVTLNPVPGGNIRTHRLSQQEFEKY